MLFHPLRAATVIFGLLTVTLLFPPDRVAAQTASSASKQNYVGLWNSLDDSGWRAVYMFNADGTCSDGGVRFGTWGLEGNQLVVRYDAHSDWVDSYGLPVHNGILKGRAGGGEPRTLTQRAASAPAATYAALAGPWGFFNHDDGHRAVVVFTPEGSITENGRQVGDWMIEANRLYYSFSEHHEWVDIYDLPPKSGVLEGRNIMNHHLTLSRAAATAAVATSATSTPAVTKPSPAAASTGSYFGATRPGSVPGVEAASRSAATPPLPALATPPPVGRTMGGYAGGNPVSGGVASGAARPGATAAPTLAPSVAAAAATPAPELLTPVGTWHWHSGEDVTLTDKGAVLQDKTVIGQWHWTSKDKGEIQIQWSGTHYRPPVTYSVSPHGHHLNGSDPTHKDQTFSEDRAE